MITFTWEQIRRWRVAAHSLDQRAPRAEWLNVINRIGGLHAQMLSAAELSLWARVDGLQAEDVGHALWEDRTLVKSWMMRGTLYIADSKRYPLITAALSQTRLPHKKGAWLKYFKVTKEEIEAILDNIPKALDGNELTREALTDEIARLAKTPHLREALQSGWGALLKPAAAQGILCFGPNQGQHVTFARPDQWISGWQAHDPQESFLEMVRTYFYAYGPTTAKEFERWWGAEPRDVKAAIKQLGDELVEVDVEGWKALALASKVDEMASAPETLSVNLLPNFDPYTISVYLHREHLIDNAYNGRVYRPQAWISPVVLVNGWMSGIWSYEQKKSTLEVSIEWFEKPSSGIRYRAVAEAEKLAQFFGLPLDLKQVVD
jgi:hypothetical protein